MSDDAHGAAVDPTAVQRVAERADVLRAQLRGWGGDDLTLVAVTKGFGADTARVARAAGLLDLGENYAQELADKAQQVAGVRWHAIGSLQRNKVRLLAPFVSLWQAVDRVELIDELGRRCPGAAILIQVNASAEPQKSGCALADVDALVERGVAQGLAVRGLMAIGVAGDPARTESSFRTVRSLADRLGLAECSMGMSDDLPIAVACGSTMVRVGRALFGDRPPRSS